MNDRPKIKDIAERAGVSPATVSRALTDSGLVTEATRRRIHEIARELNYRPNVRARNLRTQRSMAVLLVVRDVGNPFYLDVLKGVEAVGRATGYSVLMGNTENDPEREAEYFDMLRDGHADGMILMTGKLPGDIAGQPAGIEDLAVVVALEIVENAGLPHVQIDNIAASRSAVRHLVDLGHRRIAHITGPMPETMSVGRRDGYRQAMAEAGFDIPEGYEQQGPPPRASARAAVRQRGLGRERPPPIPGHREKGAGGAIPRRGRGGGDVPGVVPVAGSDVLYPARPFSPPLTTVSQPRLDIGRMAMTVLLAILAGEAGPAEPIVMPTELLIRASTAPPAA